MNKVTLFGVLAVIAIALFMHSVECRELDGPEECGCPARKSPYCGSDGKTYSNSCWLRCEANSPRGKSANLRIAHPGKC